MTNQTQNAYWYPEAQLPPRYGWEIQPWEIECQRMPPPQPGEVERWIQELMEDPELDAAEDLLEAFGPADPPYAPVNPWVTVQETKDLYIWSDGLPPPQITRDTPVWSREPGPEKPGSLRKTVSNAIFYAVLGLVVVGAVIFGNKSNGKPFFGFSYFEVRSGSMEDVIPQGSLVVTKRVPAAEIRVGDIITYLHSNGDTITHKVAGIVPNFDGNGALGFQTRGTKNLLPDPDLVGASDVVGVVKFHVKNLGFTLRYVADNIRYVFLFFLLVLLGPVAARALVAKRKKERGEETEMGERDGRAAESAPIPMVWPILEGL